MKSKLTWGMAATVTTLVTGAAWLSFAKANSTSQETNLPGLMLAKLASTQRVVTGLVSKDFTEIKRGANDLISICDASQWETHPDPVYGQYKAELRRNATRLSELADQQNLDGAAFGYFQTISTCVSCHSHCRDILRIAEAPIQAVPIPVFEGELQGNSMPRYRR
jgi:hypothetical protein